MKTLHGNLFFFFFFEYLLRTQRVSYTPVLETRQIFKLRWGQGDSAIWGLLRSVANEWERESKASSLFEHSPLHLKQQQKNFNCDKIHITKLITLTVFKCIIQ